MVAGSEVADRSSVLLDNQRELPFEIGLQVDYAGSLSRHLLPGTINVDQLPDSYFSVGSQLTQSVANQYYGRRGSGVISGSTVAYNQGLRPFPQFSSVNVHNDTATAKYNSLNVKAQRRFTKGLIFLTTYPWSKNEDSTWRAGSNFLFASHTSRQDVHDLAAKWSWSVMDIPHRFNAATTYDLPIGRGQMFSIANPVWNLFAGNWSLNTVTIFQSGSLLVIYQNINNNKALGTFAQRPNLTGTNPCYSGSPEGRLDSVDGHPSERGRCGP